MVTWKTSYDSKHKDNEINFTSTNDSVISNVFTWMANFVGDFLFIFSVK